MGKQAKAKRAKPGTKLPEWANPFYIQPSTKATRTHTKQKPTTKGGGVSIPKVWKPEHVLVPKIKKK